MMTALSPPSSCSITNSRVCYPVGKQTKTLRPSLTAFIAESCSSFIDMPESPEEKETASEKHKNNSGSDVHIKSVYQNIPKNTILLEYW